ncbi:DUF481 domain-containing protein [Shewanella surugensis]|uniref:DUF481 domain-containing protein n=1 Tax=Shewanella surugensis TaxID=212020 RepID=A0ABT0LGJ4_9GAMM|nr:DUF481 domain-containing protein [Shewanella surugensis]MCL1126291.1 DUF481 domain-containing protein [Shewanella surugensis]
MGTNTQSYHLFSWKNTQKTAIALFYSLITIGPQALATPAPKVLSEPAEKQSFTPAELTLPKDTQYDWIQLSSLEMLKGTLNNLYEETVEFKSKEFGTLSIDWDDVLQLHTSHIVSVGLEDLTTQTGQLTLINNQIDINHLQYPKNEVMTIITGNDSESNYWSTKVTLGADFYSGNTDQIDYSAIAYTRRRTTESRFNLTYLGSYSRTDGVATINNHRLNSNFDWFISRHFYLRPVFGEVYKDPFLNYDYKITLGSGVGYNLIDTSTTEWKVSGGPAYVYTRFDEVESGEEQYNSSPAIVVETDFDTKLTNNIDFNALYRIQYGSDDAGGYTHHVLTGFSIELTESFDLDLSFVWDRVSQPQADSDGEMPKKDDFQFIVGLGISM